MKTLSQRYRLSNSSEMVANVVPAIFKKSKIFGSVVVFYFVNMVDTLTFFKKSSYLFFHNKSVLQNVPITIRLRVVRLPNLNVPIASNIPTAFPVAILTAPRVFGKAFFEIFRVSCTIKRTILSFFKLFKPFFVSIVISSKEFFSTISTKLSDIWVPLSVSFTNLIFCFARKVCATLHLSKPFEVFLLFNGLSHI
jgi:hypothetical protein